MPDSNGNGGDTMADRFSEAVEKGPRRMRERMQEAVKVDEREMFSRVQQGPIRAATVRLPDGTETEVLYPAEAPQPPGTFSTRPVGPAEALSLVATQPFELVNDLAGEGADFLIVPDEATEQFD